MNLWQAIKLGFAIKREIKHLQGGDTKMDYGKMFVKGAKVFGYAIVSILAGALIKGLASWQPQGDVENIIYKMALPTITALLVAFENWWKHRGTNTSIETPLPTLDRRDQ